MKFLLLSLLSVQLFAVNCDSLYEYFLNKRESNKCTEIESAAIAYKIMEQNNCVLDKLDKDFGEYLVKSNAECHAYKGYR